MVAANISENVGNPQASRKVRKVPNYLVWETLDGQPLYRRGYKDVMRKTKTFEEIMGTSSYQSIINSYILGILFTKIDLQKYDILTNEIGVHFKKNDNSSNDIAIYKRLESTQITKKYTDFAAKIVIEIDIDIDPDSMPNLEYLDKKTQKMLDFGVEKVIWVLTNIKKVMVATPNSPWFTIDWSSDIEIMDGIYFNIEKYLIERGVK
jgi:hypothetical protein